MHVVFAFQQRPLSHCWWYFWYYPHSGWEITSIIRQNQETSDKYVTSYILLIILSPYFYNTVLNFHAGSYVCGVCGKKYKYYNCFQTHVRAHRGKTENLVFFFKYLFTVSTLKYILYSILSYYILYLFYIYIYFIYFFTLDTSPGLP